MAADCIALVIRWGRTERQFVQFALDTLRSAKVLIIGVILNDINLKAQRRRGYRDHTVVYMDKGLYQAAPGAQEAPAAAVAPAAMQASLPMAAAVERDAYSETSVSEPHQPDKHYDPRGPARSDIERLYDRYHD